MNRQNEFSLRYLSVIVLVLTMSICTFAQPDPVLLQDYKASVSHVKERADKQLKSVSNSLVARHLTSISNLVQLECLRISTLGDSVKNAQIEESKKFTDLIAEGLTDKNFKEDDLIVTNKRKMVMSFLSPRDKSLQYYILSLPVNFDSDISYPLLVSLHGSGPSHPLFYAHLHFLPTDNPVVQNSANIDDHIRVIPWGRGNAGYAEYAETDVWECLDDLNKFVKIDPDRRYLEGHSMGARGAFNYAVRKPDYWAAVAIYSLPLNQRYPSLADLSYAKNLVHTPIYIWMGEKDNEIYHQSTLGLKTELEVYQAEFVFKSSPELGHSPSPEVKAIAQEWLFKKKRKVPTSFHYKTNQPTYRGVWGVGLNYNPEVIDYQSVDCVVSQNIISIVTSGTSGISVNTGELGLTNKEQGKIYWNGKLAYEGAFNNQTIKMGEIAEPRRRR